jgi:hypothetical protein
MSTSANPVLVLITKSHDKNVETAKTGEQAPITPPKVEPKPRTLSWDLKPEWTVGETIDLSTVKVTVLPVEAPANFEFLSPPGVPLAKGTDKLTVTGEAIEKDGYATARLTADVVVKKRVTHIKWRNPQPVLINTALDATQLDATIEPNTVPPNKLVYTPASGHRLTEAKKISLSVSYPGDDAHEKSGPIGVQITVVSTSQERASATGSEDMLTGRAWNGPPDALGKQLLADWESDKDGIKTQGRKLMTELNGKTGAEIITYMNKQVKDQSQDFFHQTLNANNNPAKFPNMIWKFANGLQVRYKPNGDDRNEGVEMFCIEGQTNAGGFSRQGTGDVAFKLMSTGDPGCPGPPPVKPAWVPGGINVISNAYNAAACALTHLECQPMKDQNVVWAGPIVLEIGTALTNQHLKATALDGVVPTYKDSTGAPVTVGQTLTAGDHQVVAVAAANERYKEGTSAPVTITINLKPQTITWKGDKEIFIDTKLGSSHASALGNPPLTFLIGGKAVDPSANLAPGESVDITVNAAPKGEYAAATQVFTIKISKRGQRIVWNDPPGLAFGDKFTADHLNAEVYVGDIDITGQAQLKYTDEAGETIKIGSVFTDAGEYAEDETGATRKLFVKASRTQGYDEANAEVTIEVIEKQATAKDNKKKPAKQINRKRNR